MSWWNKLFSSYAFHEYFRGLTPQFVESIDTEDTVDSIDPVKLQDMIPSNVVPPQIEKYISPRVAKSPMVKNPVLSFKMRPGAAGFEQPEYDLTEIGRISDVEGYVNRAFLIKTGLMFKEGWELVGRNNLTIKYIKERFEQMSAATGTPMGITLQHIGADLIETSNSFLVRVRNLKASGGQVRILPGTKIKLEPTAGYFPMHVSTVKFRRDEYGNILQYRQQLPSGYYQDFESPDVLHFYYHRKEGFLVGTPSLIPVKDDIRALRRIEENIEMLLYQHLFPLYHYQVGTLEAPARMNPDGMDEVQVVQGEINSMPSEGMIVTSERHKIVAIGAESRALRAESYLLHFKQRVFAGLGASSVDFGDADSSNRSCYSEDTETLTDSGFKYYWEITEEDKIATYNPDTNQLEFCKPNGDILLHHYSGKMYHFKNRNVDTLVTPDHDIWVGHPLWKRIQWEKVHADTVHVANYWFLDGGLGWQGIEPEDFLLPYVPYRYHPYVPNAGPFGRINIKDWLEFLGYFVSEGCLAKGKGKWAVTLSQNSVVNFEKCNKIRNCLQRLPFKFLEYTDPGDHTTRFWIHCKSLYLYLQENCGDYGYLRCFPTEILEYSIEYLRIAFEAAMLGDGTSDTSREGRTSRTYYSTSDLLIDQIQEMALKLGYRAHALPGAKGCKRVCMSKRKFAHVMPSQVSIVDYDGMVYCFNVPNHLFVTRRGGRIGIHGNTAENMSRNMVDDVKYYQMTMEMFVNEYIIKELLLESTFPDPLSTDNVVTFRFNEIDNDAKIKQENHSLNAFNSHALTFSELRRAFGKEPLTDEEWKDTFWELFEKPKAIIMAVDEPYTEYAKEQVAKKQAKTEAQAKGVSKEPAKTGEASKGAVASTDKPSNQHGQKMSPGKRNSAASNLYTFDTVANLWSNFKKSADKVISSHEELQLLTDIWTSTLKEKMNILARIRFREGIKDVYGEYVLSLDSKKIMNEFNKLQQYVEHHVEQSKHILQDLTSDTKTTIFDLLDIKIPYITDVVSQKAFNAGVKFGEVQRKMDS